MQMCVCVSAKEGGKKKTATANIIICAMYSTCIALKNNKNSNTATTKTVNMLNE